MIGFLNLTPDHDRRCPGMHVANSNLLIAFAYTLVAFGFLLALEDGGGEGGRGRGDQMAVWTVRRVRVPASAAQWGMGVLYTSAPCLVRLV